MLRLFVVVFVLATVVPAMAKKPAEWCLGNGCITGGAPLAGGSSDMLACWHGISVVLVSQTSAENGQLRSPNEQA
jgi:hypothetical protein